MKPDTKRYRASGSLHPVYLATLWPTLEAVRRFVARRHYRRRPDGGDGSAGASWDLHPLQDAERVHRRVRPLSLAADAVGAVRVAVVGRDVDSELRSRRSAVARSPRRGLRRDACGAGVPSVPLRLEPQPPVVAADAFLEAVVAAGRRAARVAIFRRGPVRVAVVSAVSRRDAEDGRALRRRGARLSYPCAARTPAASSA